MNIHTIILNEIKSHFFFEEYTFLLLLVSQEFIWFVANSYIILHKHSRICLWWLLVLKWLMNFESAKKLGNNNKYIYILQIN
jgi:hypothetical protein